MTRARLYKCPQKATQSGKIRSHRWILDYGQSSPRSHDSLTGWVGCSETQTEVKLSFPTKDQAIQYAEKNSIAYDLKEPGSHHYVVKNYEDNFHNNRKMNWAH